MCVDIRVSLERVPALFTARVTERHAVCIPAGHRGSGVRKRKLASPFGRCPNWLGSADRMLTEHTEQTGSPPLPFISSQDFHKKISL